MNELIFPPETLLKIDHIEQTDRHLSIYVRSQKAEAACPDCETISSKVHDRYQRHPQDLSCFGFQVRLHIEVRRFVCQEVQCPRKTFAEPLTGLLNPNARRTIRLKAQHSAIAYALGGESGSRLSHELGVPLSGDTLIREIRLAPEPTPASVRAVGVDDWAMKKGCVYGTILVDLEKRQPIDLLPTRDAETVTAWFEAHPEIQIISRDRGKEYIKAATEGAPQAQQVADRWHLLKNLREAVTTFLQSKPVCLQATAQPVAEIPENKEEEPTETDPSVSPPPEPKEAPSPNRTEQEKATRRSRRQARYERVRELKQAGHSKRAIARQMNISRKTVRKYIEANTCPQYAPRVRKSKLSPWLPYLEQRWQGGCTNASQLWREIKSRGFSGCLRSVSAWAAMQRELLPAEISYSRQQTGAVKPTLSRHKHPVPRSAQQASWLVILDDDKLDEDEKAARERMLAADAEMPAVERLVRQFIRMVKERRVDDLDQWFSDVTAGGIKTLQRFADGLRTDLAAVRNALSMSWSNGQTEGQVNRLKFIKRQMYGRANLDLLRKRVLHQSSYG